MKKIVFDNLNELNKPSEFSNKSVNNINNLGWEIFTKNFPA